LKKITLTELEERKKYGLTNCLGKTFGRTIH